MTRARAIALAAVFLAQTPASAERLVLSVGGSVCGGVARVEGGDAKADVAVTASGDKHIAGVSFEPVKLELGFGAAGACSDWIAQSWSGQPTAVEVSVIDIKLRTQMQLNEAWIQQVTIPRLDLSHTPVGLELVLVPGSVRREAGAAPPTSALALAPLARASRFRLEIPGVDCSGVTSIGPLRFTNKLLEYQSGSGSVERLPASIEFADLEVALSDASAAAWREWFEKSVIEGEASERSGTLYLLPAKGEAELAHVELRGLGLISLAASRDGEVLVKLYSEGMRLTLGAKAD